VPSPATLTLDLDWAPDFAIEDAARLLIQHRVCATWFVTHATPALALLRANADLFELGIHPNFLPGSSHGATPEAVIDHCLALVPEARAVRTHALVQSTPLLAQMVQRSAIRVDVSLLHQRGVGLRGFELPVGGARLLRLPYFWEDDVEMDEPQPRWRVADLPPDDGLRILDFHPIHVALNSASMAPYAALKQQTPRLHETTRAECQRHANTGSGTGTLFRALVEALAGTPTRRISELAALERARL
jgi:hypothetical protein